VCLGVFLGVWVVFRMHVYIFTWLYLLIYMNLTFAMYTYIYSLKFVAVVGF